MVRKLVTAKRATKTSEKAKQGQSGDAKSPKLEFCEVFAVRVAECKRLLKMWRRRKSRFADLSNKSQECVRKIGTCQRRLKLLEERRQRYERYQANETIPIELREEIAKAETEILRMEVSNDCEHLLDTKRELHVLQMRADRIEHPQKTRNAAFKVGKRYRLTRIEKEYDEDVREVLFGHFGPTTITRPEEGLGNEIVAALPTKGEYLELRERFYTTTLADLMQDAYLNLFALQREVQGQVSLDVQERLHWMLNEETVLPSCVSSLSIVFYPMSRMLSEPKREAAARMLAIANAIEEYRNSGVDITNDDSDALICCRVWLRGDANEVLEVFY